MQQRDANVQASLSRVFEASERLATSRMPNEHLPEMDLDRIKIFSRSLKSRLEYCENDNLILEINGILSEFGFPEIEHDTASRGLLVAKLQGLEVITSLQEAKNLARTAGYRDPDIANINLDNSVSKVFLEEVAKSLDEVKETTRRLDAKLSASKQNGFAVGVAGISIDTGILVHLIKINTKDAREYIDGRARISAEVLKSKLQKISDSSSRLMDAISSNSKKFGRKIVELSTLVARAAQKTYLIGLNFIKTSFERPDKETHPSSEDTSATLSDEKLDKVASSSGDPAANFTAAKAVILQKLDFISKSRRAPDRYLNQGDLVSCKFLTSHNNYYLVFRFSASSKVKYAEGLTLRPISVTEIINRAEFLLIGRLNEAERNRAAKEAYSELKNKTELA